MIRQRPTNTLRDGLVGFWSPAVQNRLVGGTGALLPDLSGRVQHGTLMSMDPATDWVTSGGYSALDFDGSNDYVTCGVIPYLSRFTISLWMSCSSFSAYRNIISKVNSASAETRNYSMDVEITTGKIRAIFTQGLATYRVVTTNAALTLNTLTHVGFTWDGATSAVYLNGKLDNSSTAWTGDPDSVTGPLLLGDILTTAALPFPGQIAELAIYSRGLPAGTLADLHRVGPGGIFTPRRRRVAGTAAAAPPAQSNAGFWIALMGGVS